MGNIAGQSPMYRDLVLEAGALPPLLELCKPSTYLPMLRNATWSLSNFCRGKPEPPFELVAPALSTLNALIRLKDDEVLTDACWALSYLCDSVGEPPHRKIQALVAAGVCGRLVELLMYFLFFPRNFLFLRFCLAGFSVPPFLYVSFFCSVPCVSPFFSLPLPSHFSPLS